MDAEQEAPHSASAHSRVSIALAGQHRKAALAGNHKSGALASPLLVSNKRQLFHPGAAAPSMASQPGAVVQGDQGTSSLSLDRLLGLPPPLPRIRTRPWWFPVQELRDPLVFHLEAWLADSIFGPDRATVPEMEWMNQVLLTVNTVNSGSLVEISVFGQPRVQNRVKSLLLSLASRYREHRAREEKMKQLEEFLKARGSGPQLPVG